MRGRFFLYWAKTANPLRGDRAFHTQGCPLVVRLQLLYGSAAMSFGKVANRVCYVVKHKKQQSKSNQSIEKFLESFGLAGHELCGNEDLNLLRFRR
jgi:hypothetical protein